MEEVDLRWVKASGSWGNCEINWRKSSDSGFSGYFVGFEFLLELENWGICKDESNFILEERDETFKLWKESSELFCEIFEFIFLNTFSSHSDNLLSESVFVNNEGSIIFSQCLSDLVNLGRSDIGEVSKDDLFMIA